MKSLEKHAWLVVALYTLIACNATKRSGSGNQNNTPIQQIDSLPATIINPKTEPPDSIVLTDSTSRIEWNDGDLFSINLKLKALERLGIDLEKEGFFKIQELSHIKFRDLKLAIDDYGNINYLDLDF